MKSNQKNIFIALLFLLFGAVLVTTYKNSKNYLTIKTMSVEEADGFFNIRAEYPQFNAADRVFNDKIKNLIVGKIADFKKTSRENWQARQATVPAGENMPTVPETPFDFIATWEHNQLNNRYISFVIKIYYFSGGAHGNDELYAFNYDVKNRKELTIMDFVGSLDNLQKISLIAKEQVAAELESTGWGIDSGTQTMLDEGAAPTSENYKDFGFNSDSLIVYFQKYQVAPGAAGGQQTIIYKSNLASSGINLNWPK
jgi:hypothetical protein